MGRAKPISGGVSMKLNEMIDKHSSLQKTQAMILIMRHAEKYIAEDFRLDSQQVVTTQGKLDAEKLGTDLCDYFSSVANIHSSPMPRCIETATALAKGFRFKKDILIQENLNADGGLYVEDVKLAKANFIENKNPISVFNTMLSGQLVPGMKNVEQATAKLLQVLLNDLAKLEHPAIYVTHDSILALLVGTLIGKSDFVQESWFKYLEGICIKQEEQSYKLFWRQQSFDIAKRCNQLLDLLHNPKSVENQSLKQIDKESDNTGLLAKP